jgi:hypothetical protein
MLKIAHEAFVYDSWPQGDGGKEWGKCTAALIELDTAILEMLRWPTHANVLAMTEKLNLAVNQAHNNGWWMNKFTGDDLTFTYAAEQNLTIIAEAGWAALQVAKEFTNPRAAELVEQYKLQQPIVVAERMSRELPEEDSNDSDESDDDIIEIIDDKPMEIEDTKEEEPLAVEPDNPSGPTKLSKIVYNPIEHKVTKIHVRYEAQSGNIVSMHFQFAVGEIGYFSRTVQVAVENVQEFLKPLQDYGAEGSYSSDAGGYYPAYPNSEKGVNYIVESYLATAAHYDTNFTITAVWHDGKQLPFVVKK